MTRIAGDMTRIASIRDRVPGPSACDCEESGLPLCHCEESDDEAISTRIRMDFRSNAESL